MQTNPPDPESVGLTDAFEMGYWFAMSLRGQVLEDSRAVGRLLTADIFKPIASAIDREIKERGFDSFTDAERGMFQAKRIVRSALQAKETK